MCPRLFLTGLALLLGLSASAQFGISAFQNWNKATWGGDKPIAQPFAAFYPNSKELAVNYWFRLPTRRIEFQPTIYANGFFDGSEHSEYGFQFKTNLYIFDFAADCDCPTFGKQGPQLQKGFFVQLSPGVARHRSVYDPIDYDKTTTVFTVGGGVGIDFGISNLLTLTPLASVRYTLGNFQEDINRIDGDDFFVGGLDTRLFTYQIGLQATIRLDKRRY